jgi:HK97 family phage major capsid protein
MNESLIKELQESIVALKAETNAKLEAKDASVVALQEELNAKADRLDSLVEDAAERKELLEELQAKLNTPGVIAAGNKADEDALEKQKMDDIALYMKEGEEALRSKGTDLQASTDSQGGFAVPEELRRQIILLEHESSPIRQVVDVRTSETSDVKQLVSTGGAASGWVGETTARTQTNSPDLAQRTAVFGEVYAMPRAYQHVLEDAFFDVNSWLAGEVAREFAEQSNLAFLSGDGTNKPIGFLANVTSSADRAANDTTGLMRVMEAGNNQLGASDAAIITFLRSVVSGLKSGYRRNAKWMMNQATYDVLADMKNANGDYFLNRDIANAAVQRLLGYDIVINEDMGDIDEAVDSYPIIFGDFARTYQIIDRTGVSTLRDPYTNKGSVMFYTRKRVGSMLKDVSASIVVGVNHI